jgi:hypothetical protein
MSSDPTEHVVYGLDPKSGSPLVFTAPPVEATPDQPLPDAGPFLRVFAGVEEPTTALLRCGREFIGIWRYAYENRLSTRHVEEQMDLLTWLADREAGGHTKAIAVAPDTPTYPSSYGQMVAWLAWKYLLVALRRDDPTQADRDAATFLKHAKAFDQLVSDVRAGVVQLPQQATDVFPPTVPEDGMSDTSNGNETSQ